MELNADTGYRAILARDPRFDGVFFVGVSTTGIYCRPICPAKTPARDRCRFFGSAAAAESAGFRPCLRCRPELAPGRAHVDAVGRLAASAFSRIEEGALNELSLDELAEELGVSARHLRRSVEQAYGVAPVQLAQTQRLLSAKRLLTDTSLSIGEIAFAAGFSSVRRFNSLFQDRYRMSPGALRKANRAHAAQSLVCEIGYQEPFAWGELLEFLGRRAILGVEEVTDDTYRRTIRVKDRRGVVSVACVPERRALRVEMSVDLASVLPQVVGRMKRLFDTATDPAPILDRLGDLARDNPGLRVPGAVDGFEIAVRAIVGQQVSVSGARTIAGRLAARFGETLPETSGSLTHTFPTAHVIAVTAPEDVSILGMPRKRGETIVALARAVTSGALVLRPGRPVESVLELLKEIPGIGDWTAQYIAMRALSWPDAFPHADLGIRKALSLKNDREVLALAEAWRPWRAYAALHLWKSLDGLTLPVSAGRLPRSVS